MKAAMALNVDPEWLRTGEGEPRTFGAPTDLGTLRERATALPDGGFKRERYFDLGLDLEEPLLRSCFAAVDEYVKLMHQAVPMQRRLALAANLRARCQSLGLDSAEKLSLLQLHSAVGEEIFP